MKPRLLVHIGTHKTGTTALQRHLKQYQKELQAEGISYIDAEDWGLGRLRQVKELQAPNESIVEKLRSFLKNRKKRAKTYVLSNEAFSGNPLLGYQNASAIASLLRRATEGEFQAEILVVFRRQDEFISSMYMQSVHQNKEIPISHFLQEELLQRLDWRQLIEAYASEFGEQQIYAFPYDRKVFEHHSIVSLLNLRIGSEVLKRRQEAAPQNVGYSELSTKIARLCKDRLNKEEAYALRVLLQESSNKGKGKEYQILPAEQKAAIYQRFAEGNRQLAKEHFDRTCPLPEGFSPPLSVGEAPQGEEELLQLQFTALAKIMAKQMEILRIYEKFRQLPPMRLWLKVKKNFFG